MNGRPVWLASGSVRDSFGRAIPSARWTFKDLSLLERTLLSVLEGVGDQAFERFFQMPVTGCIHRKLTEKEEAGLHPSWNAAKAVHMAGGPLAIIRETCEGSDSTKPCVQPLHLPSPGDPDDDVFLLEDCGLCVPCKARLALECPRALRINY